MTGKLVDADFYEGGPLSIETLTVLLKGQNFSPNIIHSPQVLHICDLEVNYHTAACKGYDKFAF